MPVGIESSEYKRVFESVPALFLLLATDPEFTIVDASDAYLKATHVRREQVVGRGMFEVFPDNPNDTNSGATTNLRASLERVRETGLPDTMALQKYDVRGPDGRFEARYWSPVNSPVLDRAGEVEHIVHRVEDVTELVNAREALLHTATPVALKALLRSRTRELEMANRQLREANELFRAIYDQGMFAARLDLEGVVVDANRSALETCGFRRDEVVGRAFWDCGWWNRSAEAQAHIRVAVAQARQGHTFRGVLRYFRADGAEHVVDFSCTLVNDVTGRVIGLLATGLDITERMSAEQRWRAAEAERQRAAAETELERTRIARLHDLLERAPAAICVLRGPDHVFELANPDYVALIGREQESDVVGKPVREAVPEVASQGFVEVLDHVYRTGATQVGKEVGVQLRSTRTGRSRRVFLNFVYQPTRDAGGAVDGIFAHLVDVTEQVTARREVEELAEQRAAERRFFDTILSSTPDLVYVFGLDKRFTYANAALLKMWGRTAENAIGKSLGELGYEPWHAQMHEREIDQVVATKRPIRGEVPFTGTEGRRTYDYIFVPVLGAAGEVVAIAGTTRDVTEMAQARETVAQRRQELERLVSERTATLQQAIEQMEEFSYSVSHDLRSPARAIQGYAEALLQDHGATLDGEARHLLERIHRSGVRMDQLIRDLLTYTRISRREVRLQPVEMTKLVGEVLQQYPELRPDRADIVVPAQLPMVLAHEPSLTQVISNLLTNAVKFVAPGTRPRVEIGGEQPGDRVRLWFKDNGIGIAPKYQGRLFGMFERVHAERPYEGTGIGLAIVRKAVERMNGRVGVESDGMAGSLFWIELPAAATGEGTGRTEGT